MPVYLQISIINSSLCLQDQSEYMHEGVAGNGTLSTCSSLQASEDAFALAENHDPDIGAALGMLLGNVMLFKTIHRSALIKTVLYET